MGKQRGALRILVVDDFPIVREGIRMCLRDRNEVEIIAEAGDGQEAIQQVKALRPDVVLLDVTMPRMGGLEALPHIRRARPRTKVIIVTVHHSREYLKQAMAAHADGYLLKDTAPSEYVEAICAVAAGRIFVSAALVQENSHVSDEIAGRLGLTSRELQYLALAAQGKRRSEIASAMRCGTPAVRSYQRRVLAKLGMKDMASLTRFALQSGL